MKFKGQFWSIDVIFSIVIFTVALTLLAYTWYNINNELSLSYGGGSDLISLQASTLAGTFMSTGYPSDWENEINLQKNLSWLNVSVGIDNNKGYIDPAKLYTFMAMENSNYQATKTALGTSYNYYISIQGKGINLGLGLNPSTNKATSIATQKTNSLLNGIPVTVTVEIWTSGNIAVS